jgi:uncharacterized membrane-anchored protein
MSNQRLDKYTFKPIKPPYDSERDQSIAYKRLFETDDGAKVLESLIIDTDYHKPDLPAGQDVTAQLAFNAGKRYVINHILSALSAEYITNEEEND